MMEMIDIKNIAVSVENGLLQIVLSRPDFLNALNRDTLQEIGRVLDVYRIDESVRGVMISGSGEKAFAAGADIKEFAEYGVGEALEMSKAGHEVMTKIERYPKPVMAVIQGFALGGGCELAMACHMRIAGEKAKFSQPEVNLGLIPGYGGTQRLPRLVGRTKAIELLLTGAIIDAQEALRLGLVNYVVPQEELQGKAMSIMQTIMDKSPLVVSQLLKLVDLHYDKTVDGYREEIHEFAGCFDTEDMKEGVTAFMGKRKAEFKGK